jgi:hypothetical protein
MVRHVLESLTDEELAADVTRIEPGWPQMENFPVKECLRSVLNEEWPGFMPSVIWTGWETPG